MLSSTLLLAKFRQLSPKVSSNLFIVLLIFLCACYVMTLKLAISPPIIKESYAIYGSKSTQYMGLLFYDMCRFAVLFAYDSRSLVHDMANCNSLEAIKSFDISTGNHGADINNPPTCRHNMKTSSHHSAAKNHGTGKNSKNSCNRFTVHRKTLEHAGDTSNSPSDEEHNTNDDSNDSTNTNGTQSARTMNIEGIKIVHWNCRGANGKLSAIKDATQKDCIDILLLQDTRLSRRDDGLPKLRLHGYSTYDVPQSETSHGMVILVHKDIPSDLAQQFVFGPQAESLTIRIWICGSSYLIHNIYNNGATVNLSAAPLNERSMFLGDFNAHHRTWCQGVQNRAGINISDQLDHMDEYVMMNLEDEEYEVTTIYDTTIDLSIVHRDIAGKVHWSIYSGLSSDHFAVMITWYPGCPPKRNNIQPKYQMHQADWGEFKKIITSDMIDFHNNDDLDEFNAQLSEVLRKAAEQSIPKSSPGSSVKQYWRYDLGVKCAKQDYNQANKRYRSHRTDTNKQKMVEKFDIYKDICKHVQERSWRQWVEQCNFDISSTELWRRLRSCTGVASRPPTHPNPEDKAEQLCHQFIMRSDPVNLSTNARRKLDAARPVREAAINNAIYSASPTDRPFNMSELEHALLRKKDTAPGDDGCTYSMIRQAPLSFKQQFLNLCNQSWNAGKLPTKWKAVKLVPIPKKDGSFRPISLISVMSKVFERMVLNRIKWNAHPVNMYSLGFRNRVGTQDAIATVVSHITKADAFRKKHSAALVLIDVEKAFEMVSSTVVLHALAHAGVCGNMLSWIQDFLNGRTGAVQFQNEHSSNKTFRNGTPQGSCLSPTLFSYVISHLLDLKLPTSVQLVAYADDLALTSSNRDNDKVINDIQTALETLNAEAEALGLKFSPAKTKAMWFYTQKPDAMISLNGQRLPWSPTEKYLGIELDSSMRLTHQANHSAAIGKKNLNALKVLSSLTDTSAHILKRVYSACVQSGLDYGAILTPLMCKTSITKLQRVQNQGMRLILGAPKWTCTTSMSQELTMLPVRVRSEIAVAKLVDKIKFMPSHPLHVSCARPAIINKERSKWLIRCRDIHRKLAPRADDRTVEIFQDRAPWETSSIIYNVNHTITKTTSTPEELRTAAMHEMQNLPIGTHYYTDGSKSDSRAAAAYVVNNSAVNFRLNNDATITQAELMAILGALDHAVINHVRPIIHTDSLTAIQILMNNKESERFLCNCILSAAKYIESIPVINWIPSHVGIEGNERADTHAKEGLQREIVDYRVKCSHLKVRTHIRNTAVEINDEMASNCKAQTFGFNSKLDHNQQRFILGLPRKQQKMIHQIRLTTKSYAQIRREEEKCPYCEQLVRNKSKHWCVDCPAMVFERELMLEHLTSEQLELRDVELAVAIINSQNSRKYRELLLMLKKFPI